MLLMARIHINGSRVDKGPSTVIIINILWGYLFDKILPRRTARV